MKRAQHSHVEVALGAQDLFRVVDRRVGVVVAREPVVLDHLLDVRVVRRLVGPVPGWQHCGPKDSLDHGEGGYGRDECAGGEKSVRRQGDTTGLREIRKRTLTTAQRAQMPSQTIALTRAGSRGPSCLRQKIHIARWNSYSIRRVAW